MLTGDTYKGFLAFLSFVVLNLAAMMFSGDAGFWSLISWPSGCRSIWWFQPIWFTEMGVGAVLPWQECWTAVFCGLATLALLYLTGRHFGKRMCFDMITEEMKKIWRPGILPYCFSWVLCSITCL
jgi:hypothetical protein